MSNLWIQSRRYDSLFFLYSGIFCLFLILPFLVWGNSSIWPIYNLYLVVFGLPHNYLTWATLIPADAKKDFNWEPIRIALIFSGILCLMIPFIKDTNFGDWVLSFIAYYSLWHAYRQHAGICKIYDVVQSKRYEDPTLFDDRKPMNLFFGLGAFGVVVWLFTRQKIFYLLSPHDSHELIHPVLPREFFYGYVFVTVAVGLHALKKLIFDRKKRGIFIPWPQIVLTVVALSTYVVPYFFIPVEALPIIVAIGTIYHNVQYFGFVWAFEKSRSQEMEVGQKILGLPQRLAARGSWSLYFGMGIVYSIFIVSFYLALPTVYGLAFVYFTGIAHYIVDGYLWRTQVNFRLKGVLTRWTNQQTG